MEKIKKILNLRSSELKPFLNCFLISFLLGSSYVIGTSVSTALFLKEFGSEHFSLMLAFNAFALMGVFLIYNFFNNKVGINRMFYFLSVIFFVLIFLISLILSKPDLNLVFLYPVLFTISSIYVAIFSAHFSEYLTYFFDTVQSKRILPRILSAGILGAILGGFALGKMIDLKIGVSLLLMVWSLSLVFVIILTLRNKRNITYKKVFNPEDERDNFLSQLKYNFTLWGKSKFIRTTLIITVIISAIWTGAEIIANTTFANLPRFSKSSDLISFYGALQAWIAFLAFILQFFLVPKLINLLGVSKLNLLTPAFFFLGFLLIFLFPEILFLSSIFLYFNMSAIGEYVESTSNNLLLNSIKPKQRNAVRAISGGILEPLTIIIVGLLLSRILDFLSIQKIAFVFGVFSLVYLLFSLFQNKFYTEELIRLIKKQNFSLLKSVTQLNKKLGPRVTNLLKENLKSEDSEKQIVSAKILSEIKGTNSLEYFSEIIEESGKDVQISLLEIFEDIGKQNKIAIEKALSLANKTKDKEVKVKALKTLIKLDPDREIIKKLSNLQKSKDKEVLFATCVLFINQGFNKAKSIEILKKSIYEKDKKDLVLIIKYLKHLEKDFFEFIPDLISLNLKKRSLTKELAILLSKFALNTKRSQIFKNHTQKLREKLKSSIKEERMYSFLALNKIGELKSDDIQLLLGDSFLKIRNLAQKIAKKENIFSKDYLSKTSKLSNNPYLWESCIKLKSYQENNEKTELILDALSKASKSLSSISFLEREYKNKDSILLLKELIKERFAFFLNTSICFLDFLRKDKNMESIQKGLKSKNLRTKASALEALENMKIKDTKKISEILEILISNLSISEKSKLLISSGFKKASNLKVSFSFVNEGNEWEKEILDYAKKSLN